MNSYIYFSVVKDRLGRYFTITEHVPYSGIVFDIDAVFAAHEDHTVLFKENVMDYSNSIEHCLFLYVPVLSAVRVQQILDKFPDFAGEITKPSRYHKCTVIKVIIVTDLFESMITEEEIQRLIRKFHFSRSYLLYLHGWTEGYIFIENIGQNKEYKCRGTKKSSYRIEPSELNSVDLTGLSSLS